MTGEALYAEVLKSAQLGAVGPFAIKRMLLRARVFEISELTPEKLQTALPHIEEAIRLYRPAAEANAAIEKVRALAR